MRSGVRFRPPRIDATPEPAWVLLRAFGPAGHPVPAVGHPPGPLDGARCLELARRLDLSPRIAARQPAALLSSEAGEEAAAGFRLDRARTVAAGLRRRALAEELAAVAAERGLPLAFLKSTALELAGVVPEGARTAADVDVLLAPEEARLFAAALEERGYRSSGAAEWEHQLPPLEAPGGGVVEVHRFLPGLRLAPSGPSATLPALERAALLVPVPELPGRSARPAREVLAAHALVHGLAQHGWSPGAYPALRLVADGIDLGLGGGEVEVERLAARVGAEVPADEVEGTADLCWSLAAGDLSPFLSGPRTSAAGALLHHFLAGALEPDYKSALKLHLLGAPTERSRLAGSAALLWRTLFPGRRELEALYGAPRGPLGAWRLRLVRPFDLARRALAAAGGRRRLSGRW